MKEVKLFSNCNNSKDFKFYLDLGKISKDGKSYHFSRGGCSNDDVKAGEKIKFEWTEGRYQYYTVLKVYEYATEIETNVIDGKKLKI